MAKTIAVRLGSLAALRASQVYASATMRAKTVSPLAVDASK
jgi:hypothetical protein